MSRKKQATLDQINQIDDVELLETKLEQIEKRLENIERFVFSQSNTKTDQESMPQVLQLLTTLIQKQLNPCVTSTASEEKMNVSEQLQQVTDLKGNQKNSDDQNSNLMKKSPLNMARLRTVI